MDDPASQIVTFSEGKGQIAVPNGYEVSFGEGGDLQLLEMTAKELRVYATFHDLNGPHGIENVGEHVVLSHAQKNGLQLMPMGDRIALVESGKLTIADGEVFGNIHWQIGFGNHLVVLSATFPQHSGKTPELELFLSSHWEEMVRSLKSTRTVH
jgi:hypothetical protein